MDTSTSKFKPTLLADFVEKAVEAAQKFFNKELYLNLKKYSILIGSYAILIGAITKLLSSIVIAIKLESFILFGAGIIFVLLAGILSYLSIKFLDLEEDLIKNTPGQLTSNAFLDAIAVISLVVGIGILGGALYIGIKTSNLSLAGAGVGAFIVFETLFILTKNPELLNIRIDNSSKIGYETLSIISLLIKSIARLVPIAFCVGLVIATILFFGNTIEAFKKVPNPSKVADQLFIISGALPLLSYLFFSFAHLNIDVVNSILSIPDKLDRR